MQERERGLHRSTNGRRDRSTLGTSKPVVIPTGVSRPEAFAQVLTVQFIGGEQEGGTGGRSDPLESLIILPTHAGIADAEQVQFGVGTCDREPLLYHAPFAGRESDMAPDIDRDNGWTR